MLNTISLRASLLAVTCLALLGACKDGASVSEGLSSDDGVLRFVPADTPYLFTSGAPLPDEMLDKFEPKVDEMLKAYQVVFRDVFRSTLAKNKGDMSADEMQRMSAVVDELATLLSIDGLRNAGFERESKMALYGNGLLPVMRIEVSDADLFDAQISRIEEAAGESMSVAELDGQSYRYVGDEEIQLVVGTFDGNAVFALVPGKFDDDQTRQLFGLTLPAKSIAETDTLANIVKEYGYTDHYLGFLDVRRIASTFIDTPTDLDAALLASMEHEPGEISDVCKQEIRDVAEIAPRLVFGYDEITEEAMSGSMVIELRKDIAAGLSTIAAAVPGLGSDPGGLLSFGISFDLMALREFYEGRLDAMEADPFECEYFADLQAGVGKGREALNQPMPPVVYAMRGFNAVVDDIGDFDLAANQPPEEIDASVLFAMEDAQTMVAMGAMFSPQLAELDLQPDGKPVKLDLPQIQALGQVVYAAMIENAVAVSVGAGAEKRVTSILRAKAVEPPPLFSMTMDAGRYYALIGEAMMVENDKKETELSQESREALRDAMLAVGEMYDRMVIDMRFTERGMEFDTRVTLKD